jgi:hypothetical protein
MTLVEKFVVNARKLKLRMLVKKSNVLSKVLMQRKGRYIPPEIYFDEFYMAIQSICQESKLHTFLEIGSSSGEGSTAAISKALKVRGGDYQLHLMEIDLVRFRNLSKKYGKNKNIYIHRLSSIALEEFPTSSNVENYLASGLMPLNRPIELLMSWYWSEFNFLKENVEICRENGINIIKSHHQISDFDFVLLDGGEFAGPVELKYVLGSKYILLDDINSYKNFESFRTLVAHPDYDLLTVNKKVRNGFAIFRSRWGGDQTYSNFDTLKRSA